MLSIFTATLLALTLTAATACAHDFPPTDDPAAHPGWTKPPFGGQAEDLRLAFSRSCAFFAKKPAARSLSSNPVFGTYGQWQQICKDALALPANDLESFLEKRLARFEMKADTAKFTGYFKPVLEGARTRYGPYQTPLVALPDDFTTACNGKTGRKLAGGGCASPYPSRADIDAAIKAGTGPYKPILWLRDPVDAYFLQIQGSGTVELDDGTIAHVGFAGKNGHPYVAIGRTLRDQGALTGSITADKIRAWLLAAHPDSATAVYHSNPSFIFFTETKAESPGAAGITLVPGRSLAIDRSVFPFGVPLAVQTRLTHDDIPWNRIMFAHDVGSAITGTVRGDIYLGHGKLAGQRAGDQNESGRLFALVPRENLGAASR